MLASTPAAMACGLLTLSFVLVAIAGWDMRRLLTAVPMLQNGEDLNRFRQTVARQMYATLGLLGLVGSAIVVVVFGLTSGVMSTKELPLLLAFGGPFAATAVWVKQVEVNVKALPASDAQVQAERDRVVSVWERKAIPNW